MLSAPFIQQLEKAPPLPVLYLLHWCPRKGYTWCVCVCCSWFAVHCTSMNNTNRLISSDNKGLAELMFEDDMNGNDTLPGKVGVFFPCNNKVEFAKNLTCCIHCIHMPIWYNRHTSYDQCNVL